MSERLSKNQFRAPWAIFWTGLALRLVVIVVGHTYRVNPADGHFQFGFEAGRIARSLVEGHGYANPFNGESGPTAWLPPLYPLLMAAAFRLFGVYTRGAAFFLLACNSVFSAAIAPAVYEIAARCFDAQGIARRRAVFFGRQTAVPVALWSAWLWAVYPAALQYAIHWIWEMSLSAFLFAWIVVVALRLRGVGEPEHAPGAKAPVQGSGVRPEAEASGYLFSPGYSSPGYRVWLAFGLLWGVLMLANASLLLCLPVMVAWILWRRVTLRGLGGAAMACVLAGLVMSPWVVRNERVLHAFVPTRSNLGMELYESTLDRNDGFPWGTTLPLWPGDPEFRAFVRTGEVRFSAQRGAEAKARIRARPGQTARWTLDRFLFFWDGTPHPPDRHPVQEYLRQLSYCFLSACGLLGLALMLWRRVPGAGLFALVFLLMPVPYYLVTVQPRFRHPIEPLIAVLAVYLLRSTEARQ